MSLLEVKNLVVEFPSRRGTLRALDDISFSIAPGEILGVVGESGAGKSLTGAAIIIASTLYITFRERRLGVDKTPPARAE